MSAMVESGGSPNSILRDQIGSALGSEKFTLRAIIFDLDNCLAPATAVGESLFIPALQAIRDANEGHLSERALEQAISDSWRYAMDWVMERHGFSQKMREVTWSMFSELEVQIPIQGYADLPRLADFPQPLFLVTSGFRRLQESKIRELRLSPYFVETLVDAIDEEPRFEKRGVFQQLLSRYQLKANEVWVVGDNPDSELAAGKSLGMKTVQTLRPDIPKSEDADFHVSGLGELLALVKELT